MHPLIAILHSAWQHLLPGHVKGMRRCLLRKLHDIAGIDSCPDHNRYRFFFTKLHKLVKQFSSCICICFLPRCQNCVHSKHLCRPHRNDWVRTHVKSPMERDSASICRFDHASHLRLIQRSVCIQASNHNSICTFFRKMPDIIYHLFILIIRI